MQQSSGSKPSDQRKAFLDRAGRVLSASLDVDRTLANLTRVVVPELADYCALDVREDGLIRRVAVGHVDPAGAELLRELWRRYPDRPDESVSVVLRTGVPQFTPRMDDERVASMARSRDHHRLLRGLAAKSSMCVPLIVRDVPFAALTLGCSNSGRTYRRVDLRLATALARRAARALDNARLYEASQAANRAKADFLAVMSHELRTPLNAVLGYAELLDSGVGGTVSAEQRRFIERIRRSSRALVTMVDEILAYSRLESGDDELAVRTTDLRDSVRSACRLLEPIFAEKDVCLKVVVPGSRVDASIDDGKVQQIVVNMLSNASKFTERGVVEVRLDRAGDAARIVVADTGIGIDAAHLDQIWEPFWQVEQPTTRSVGGTGLGLAATRRLVALLGGEIRVESAPGRGSRFIVELPLDVVRLHAVHGAGRAAPGPDKADRPSAQQRLASG